MKIKFLLTIAAILALTACGSSPTSSENASSSSIAGNSSLAGSSNAGTSSGVALSSGSSSGSSAGSSAGSSTASGTRLITDFFVDGSQDPLPVTGTIAAANTVTGITGSVWFKGVELASNIITFKFTTNDFSTYSRARTAEQLKTIPLSDLGSKLVSGAAAEASNHECDYTLIIKVTGAADWTASDTTTFSWSDKATCP